MHNGRNRIASKRTASPRTTHCRIAKPTASASPRKAAAASPACVQPQKSTGKAAGSLGAKRDRRGEIARRRKQAVSTKHRAAAQHKRRASGKLSPPSSSPTSPSVTPAETGKITSQRAAHAGDPPTTPPPLQPQTLATQEPDLPFFTPALPLSRSSEPLVSLPSPARPAYQPLSRGKALSAPQIGLWEAIGNWLHSAGRLIALGFIVKRRRPRKTGFVPAAKHRSAERPSRQTPQPSLRERTELIQLQAENRRLRQQLERMSAKTAQPPLAASPEASLFPEPAREHAPAPDAAPLHNTPAEPARAG